LKSTVQTSLGLWAATFGALSTKLGVGRDRRFWIRPKRRRSRATVDALGVFGPNLRRSNSWSFFAPHVGWASRACSTATTISSASDNGLVFGLRLSSSSPSGPSSRYRLRHKRPVGRVIPNSLQSGASFAPGTTARSTNSSFLLIARHSSKGMPLSEVERMS
jgi:hypothetical protein